jgi:gamma-glutamylcyclotransferase
MSAIRRQYPVYYFAYGSNLNWPQMQRRCPSSCFVCVARLADYQFGITRHSRLRKCGTANVFPAPGNEVWGAVYDVCGEDLNTLDGFEDGYRRQILPVYAVDNGQAPLNVLVYIAELELDVPLPNAEYKRLILEGAKHWKLPVPYLSLLEEIQAAY